MYDRLLTSVTKVQTILQSEKKFRREKIDSVVHFKLKHKKGLFNYFAIIIIHSLICVFCWVGVSWLSCISPVLLSLQEESYASLIGRIQSERYHKDCSFYIKHKLAVSLWARTINRLTRYVVSEHLSRI